jgi:lactose/cellobiose-specific phosphotransferase system IIC component
MLKRSTVWLQSIQHGFIATLPVVMLGALALTFVQMANWFLSSESASQTLGQIIQQACYGVMAIILVLSISHKLASHYHQRYLLNFDPLIVAILAMVTLVAMAHFDHGADFIDHLGVTAVGKGLLCAIVYTELYVFFYQNRILKLSYLTGVIDSTLLTAMRSIWPALLASITFLCVYLLISQPLEQLGFWFPAFIGQLDPAIGLSFWQTVKLIVVNQVSWFFGVHGSSIIETQASDLFASDQLVVYSRQFINMFAHIGGAGCTFGLVIALLFSKHRSSQRLGKYALLPSIFNINELLIFGLPIIFNRYLLIPFILVPILTTSVFRIAFHLDWVSWSGGAESWSTPVLLGGYLATGQWQGALLQVICIVISALIYYPFLSKFESNRENKDNEREFKVLDDLKSKTDLAAVYKSTSDTGRLARALIKDFNVAIQKDDLELYYQPKVNYEGRVVGAEALLRWEHDKFGQVPPSLIIALAELDSTIHDLGLWVFKRALSDMNALEKAGLTRLKIAINVSPCQFQRDSFFKNVTDWVDRSSINAGLIELEITEGQKIELDERVLQGLQNLVQHGFKIAVDDFGMGYTSLRYLKSFPVHTLKIDDFLVRDVFESKVAQEIVSSMGQLAKSMKVNLVAECVETEQQRHALHDLGCNVFQGYLFCPAVNLHGLTKYCAMKGTDSRGR